MNKTETARRRDRIVVLLSTYGELSAQALSEMLEVTVQTVRSDLRSLDDAGLVRRRHGGATLIETGENIGYQPRLALSRDEKGRIGAAVARLIPDGASIALGTGTTVEAVARALTDHRDLTVATNNLHAVLALHGAPQVSILLAGGKVRMRDLDLIGSESVAFFSGLRFDYTVFSVGGVSEGGDLMDFNLDEINIRKALCAAGRTRILVFDHTKIGRPAPLGWGVLRDSDLVVCGGDLPPALQAAASAGGARVIMV